MSKKAFLCAIVIVAILITFHGAVSSLNSKPINGENHEELIVKRQQLNMNPEILLPDNSNMEPQKFVNIKQLFDTEQLNNVAKLKQTSLMTFKEYCILLDWPDEHPQLRIAPGRMVWLVEIEYSEFHHPRLGFMKDVTIVALYDAETGLYFGSSYYGNLGNYSPFRPRFGE